MNVQEVALLVAGIVVPFLAMAKKWLNLEGKPALWFTFGVSAVVAFIAAALTGALPKAGLGDPAAFLAVWLEFAAAAFGIATLVYKQFLAKP